MTTYCLRENVSYCLIDGRPVFLDTSADRYFRLSGEAERAFVAYAAGDTCARDAMQQLVRCGILADHAPSATRVNRHFTNADDSLIERTSSSDQYSIPTAFEVLTLLLVFRKKLRTRKLQVVLDELDAVRGQISVLDGGHAHEDLANQVRSFLSARRLVPIASRCLLDSISMTLFLARRNLRADIVFGVRDDPFSAHCWTQSGGLVLNDTVGNTRSYAVIRVA